jgi:hypothetical protein
LVISEPILSISGDVAPCTNSLEEWLLREEWGTVYPPGNSTQMMSVPNFYTKLHAIMRMPVKLVITEPIEYH